MVGEIYSCQIYKFKARTQTKGQVIPKANFADQMSTLEELQHTYNALSETDCPAVQKGSCRYFVHRGTDFRYKEILLSRGDCGINSARF
ncbi:hypothetical protein PoB_000593800 [Plakobranchus ocellatus]|uniref:Uncharacterized protein n=1 Tax=Plakobranchus ocellatus TaxID=259542 RepID=A0AAV3YBA1_9GAST|nr:hypothetical protein PoB_000593800 [Plakobranchus ocellatus]